MIKNGKDTTLEASSGTVPDMSQTITGWFQKMTFTRVVRTVVNFEAAEVKTQYSAMGVIQPMGSQQLSMKPDGERAWKWYTIHADTSLSLMPGENVVYLGNEYRVMSSDDYDLYGYVKYDVVSVDSFV